MIVTEPAALIVATLPATDTTFALLLVKVTCCPEVAVARRVKVLLGANVWAEGCVKLMVCCIFAGGAFETEPVM